MSSSLFRTTYLLFGPVEEPVKVFGSSCHRSSSLRPGRQPGKEVPDIRAVKDEFLISDVHV